jgi:hypothetical protein
MGFGNWFGSLYTRNALNTANALYRGGFFKLHQLSRIQQYKNKRFTLGQLINAELATNANALGVPLHLLLQFKNNVNALILIKILSKKIRQNHPNRKLPYGIPNNENNRFRTTRNKYVQNVL